MGALPQPARIGRLLDLLGHFAADRLERLGRELGPGSAVVTGILRGRFLAPLEPHRSDAGNRRLAGGLLPVAEHLRQERPEHDGSREDSVLAEQAAVLSADPLDAFARQDPAEGESRASQKHVNNPTKPAADSSGRSGYLYGHEKTLLGFSPGSEPRRASSYRQGQGMTARSTLGCGVLKNPLRQPKVNLRAHCGTTVPFVPATFFQRVARAEAHVLVSVPFVLGMPGWRGSGSTATRRARAPALNTASAMWWPLRPW